MTRDKIIDLLINPTAKAMCAADGRDLYSPTMDIYVEGDPDAIYPWASYRFSACKALHAAMQELETAGMVVVPVEPTEAMCRAGKWALDHARERDGLLQEPRQSKSTRSATPP
jgi:hypothetical protein